MKNKLVFFSLVVFALLCITFLLIANKARKRSDAILEEFKTVDNSLKRSNDSLTVLMNTEKIRNASKISFMGRDLMMFVDTLMNQKYPVTKEQEIDLKNRIHGFNDILTDQHTSITADTIMLMQATEKFNTGYFTTLKTQVIISMGQKFQKQNNQ
ncbi:hypothetical protein [Ferruginibacter sp. HRS2-29]|uniref:hypothetical protein n=1 Tax=Ferruginibacter sp. HRS2-29 TaxID=2487334 RepID=UPI0020CD3CB5|nr:hypothetical protein [Ferruginibacter sp. HRS2-29]MCP9753357.1 hypothetical protein [Ferruginibacter sp. HRS2-29]